MIKTNIFKMQPLRRFFFGKTNNLLLILIFLSLTSCLSIDTTVKIEPGFVGQRYKKVCVMANYEVPIMQYDTEKFFCAELEDRSVKAVRGQELFEDPQYNLNDTATIAILKANNIDACVIIKRGSSNSKRSYTQSQSRTHHKRGTLVTTYSSSYFNHAVEFFISVIDLKTLKLQWSATSKTNCSGNYDSQVRKGIRIIAKDVCKRLRRDDVIGR